MQNWVKFLLCVLFSASIWLVLNLSRDYVATVSVPVVAESNIVGRSARSTSEATATAQVTASGFRHLVLARPHKRPVTVVFSDSDFRHEEGEIYSVPNINLSRYTSAIFGDGVSVESYLTDGLSFSFPEEGFKKVPVRAVLTLEFEPQYMAQTPMSFQPDSVLIYGDPAQLEHVDHVLTRPLNLTGLRSSVHGKVRLETPTGLRLSHTESIYSMEVTRYVELRSEVRIETRNVPARTQLAVLPSTATVVVRCIFPMNADPFSKAEFYIDWRDFSSSRTGRCVAHADYLPAGVLEYTITPEVFDCLIAE